MLFWVLFFILGYTLANNKRTKQNILIFHLFSIPYIVMCLYTGILYEIRLYIPLFLTSIFLAKLEFERELIRERTIAGITAARARGRMGGRKFNLTKAQVRLAEASMKNRDTSVTELCKELKITRATLYKYISPTGELRDYAKRVLEK